MYMKIIETFKVFYISILLYILSYIINIIYIYSFTNITIVLKIK